MKFIKDVSTTLLSRIITFITGILISVIISRTLQPEGKGVFITLRTVADFALALTSIGISKSMVYYIAKGKQESSKILSVSLSLSFVSALIAILIFPYLIHLSNDKYNTKNLYPFIAASVYILMQVISSWIEGYFRGTQQISLLNIISIFQPILYLLTICLLVLGSKLSSTTALLAISLSIFIVFSFLLYRLLQENKDLKINLSYSLSKSLISYGLVYQAYGLIQNLHYKIDIILISRFLSQVEVGYYSTSAALAQLSWNLPLSITYALLPLVAASQTNIKDKQNSVERTTIISRISTALLVIVVLILAIISKWLIPLMYGDAYKPSILPLCLLLPGMVTSSIVILIGGHLIGEKRFKDIVLIGAAGLLLNVILNFGIIPIYGISGAAVVSSITYSLVCIIMSVRFSRIHRIKTRQIYVITRSDLVRIYEITIVRLSKYMSR